MKTACIYIYLYIATHLSLDLILITLSNVLVCCLITNKISTFHYQVIGMFSWTIALQLRETATI